MVVKAIIFDLDDTLYNQNDSLTYPALRQAVRVMVDKGLNCDFEDAVRKISEIRKNDPSSDKFRLLARYYGCEDEEIIRVGEEKYCNADFDKIIPYPETLEVLSRLRSRFKLIAATKGSYNQQHKKIDALGVKGYFDMILINETGNKKENFLKILNDFNLKKEEVLIVGDRLDREISDGNELGRCLNSAPLMEQRRAKSRL